MCNGKRTHRLNAFLPRGQNLFKKYGFFGFFDSVLYVFVRTLRRRFYRWKRSHFGLKEALFWGKQVDKWYRYNAVLQKLSHIASNGTLVKSILEVGCGKEGLVEFYPYINNENSYKVTSIDITVTNDMIQRGYPASFTVPIKADACCIPFSDNEMDFVISIDSLEHVPEFKRNAYIIELIRVARKGVFITCPMQSNDGNFVGGNYDIKYQKWYTKYFSNPNSTISEHIELGVPYVEEVQKILTTAEIQGGLNAEVWFKCMTFSNRSILGLLTGFWFLLFGKIKAGNPPYYGGMLYIQKVP